MPTEISAITPEEQDWLTSQLGIASHIGRIVTGEETTLPDIDILDTCVTAWRSTPTDERIDTNDFINAIGIAFGETLRLRLGLQWVIATDEHGSDLALHRDANQILIYPANTAAKRITADDQYLRPLFNSFVTQIETL